MEDSLTRLQYPIGRFAAPDPITAAHLGSWIESIARLPGKLKDLVLPLSAEQLLTPYRPGGWTVQQVVHHLADSHLNSFIRLKWTLTEDHPVIKPYLEARWAELPDYRGDLVPVSLEFLESLHARWCVLLRSLGADDLTREYIHPDSGPVTLAANIGTYAWHGHHHMAQIANLGARMGWRMPPQAP